MKRTEFIKISCLSCLGASLGLTLLQSCSPQNIVNGTLTNDGITIPLTAFLKNEKEPYTYKDFLVINNSKLQNPICIFRISEDQYSAVLMKCTHQGAELQVFGDILECPAHGSEFNKFGGVENGPAKEALRKFAVSTINNKIHIKLS